jgi:hypothetical protein
MSLGEKIAGRAPKAKPKAKPFVPFAGDPKADRPTAPETRDEINAIRNSGFPDVPVENGVQKNWMNTPKVARRTKDSI